MRGAYLILFIFLAGSAFAAWAPDVDGDGCVDSQDYDSVEQKLGSTGKSSYDVDGNEYVDSRDLDIVQSYLDRAQPDASCNGFKCIPEKCNAEDDDCDGSVDEDEAMCSGSMECRSGQCVMLAGKCYDTDGKDYYSQGSATGTTAEDIQLQNDEQCYEVDIYGKLKEIKQCYGEGCYLMEYWCDSHENLVKEQYQCEFGCRFGRCRNITRNCIENDNGLDIFRNTQGTFTVNGTVIDISDKCLDTDGNGVDDTLLEYVCTEDFDIQTSILNEDYKTYEIICACKNGACTGVVEKECVDTDGNDEYTRGFSTGKTQEDLDIEGFDYCMEKVGNSFSEAESCSGGACFLNEYVCNANGNVVKFVHDCPLGCVNGYCIGTECADSETFVVSNSGILEYDIKCDISIGKPDDPLDLPGAPFSGMKTYACCSGSSEAYCVYDGTCYPSSRTHNFYELGEEVTACGCMDPSCNFEDGNHAGVWFDLDSAQELCEGISSTCNARWYADTGFKWIKPGADIAQEDGVWEYEDTEAECCGDDTGEYVTCEGDWCICCGSEDKTVSGGKCVNVEEDVSEPAAQPDEPDEEPDTIMPEQSEPITVEKTSKPNYFVILPISIALIAIIALLSIGKRYLKDNINK